VVTFGANGRQICLITGLAVQLSLLFDEPDVLQGSTALMVSAREVLRTPRLVQRHYEWPTGWTGIGEKLLLNSL